MATDYISTENPLLGWPGDLGDRKVDPVHTVPAYLDRLMAYEYLSKKAMVSILRAPGVPEWKPQKPFEAEYCPFKIYRVKEIDGASHIFCATKNFTYNKGLDAQALPYGERGVILFRKGGDGSVLEGSVGVRDLRTIGLLPGRTDHLSNTTETSNDYLAPE